MPSYAIRYKLELLCQLSKPCFEAKVPFGDNWCFLVRRLFVAKMSAKQWPSKGAFEGQGKEFLGRDLPVGGVLNSLSAKCWQRRRLCPSGSNVPVALNHVKADLSHTP